MKPLVLSLLLSTSLLYADFNAEHWHSRAHLNVVPDSVISEFTVPAAVFHASSSQLNDLRIIRDGANEVPYIIRLFAGNVQHNEREVRIRDKSWTKGKGVQAVLDLDGHTEHNRLRVSTGEHNFKQTVIVETSDDARNWATALSDGVIFDISRPETNVANLTVSYPTSTRRYVRITIPDWTDAAFLESAWLAESNETDATRDVIARLTPVVTQHATEQTSDLVFDLGASGQPCDRLVLQVEPGYFSRSAEILTSATQKNWSTRAGFTIDRTVNREHLTAEWPETWDRYIKITVFNADSAPLKFASATASAVRRTVRFPSNPGGSYALYLDNIDARSPSYDFGKTNDPNSTAAVALVGAVEVNPAYRAPQTPFSERKPWILNLILGIAVAVMAFITYRFARKATSTKV